MRNCANNEFRCKNNSGQCIPRQFVCDGTNLCADGSDEDLNMCKVRLSSTTYALCFIKLWIFAFSLLVL